MEQSSELQEKIKELDGWIKNNRDARELKRALAVKLGLQGWTYRAIAAILGVSDSFISKWKIRYIRLGIEGLKLSYKGAKSYLKPEQRQAVIKWLQEQEYWDLSELECYLIDNYDVAFSSQTSYYKILKEAKISWQKAQSKNPKQNQEIVKKKLKKLKKCCKKN